MSRFAQCESERVLDYEAKEKLRDLADTVTLDLERKGNGGPRRDKYRRLLGALYLNDQNVAGIMIGLGLAKPYDGGKCRDWCG